MWTGKPLYIAAIYNERGGIAGTGFSIREGYLITCAHVVRDALALGERSPLECPGTPLRVMFRYFKDHPEFKAVVLPGGWFPGSSRDLDADALKDIAILAPCSGQPPFPVGPNLMHLDWRGPASIFGFPSERGGAYREIEGNVDAVPETDGWLNFRPVNVSERAKLGGMSGGAIRHGGIDGICGMLSGHRIDDEFFFRVIPGRTLVDAVARAQTSLGSQKEGAQQFREDSKDRAARLVIKDWDSETQSDVTPSEMRELCAKLLAEALRRANQLPENFPYRYIEGRFSLLNTLTEGDWPPLPDRLGAFVADLAEFIAELSLSPFEMRDQIAACDGIGRKLSASIAETARSFKPANLKFHDGEWPPALAATVRENVAAIKDALTPLAIDEDSKPQASTIAYEAETILCETDRLRPHWSRMAASASNIVTAVAELRTHGPFKGLSKIASELKDKLRVASGSVISNLLPGNRFQELPFAPEMMVVPPGKFAMGGSSGVSEQPQHMVTIPKRFAVGRYPVTLEEFSYFCRKTGRKNPSVADGKERHPVVEISWDDARAYIEWLNGMLGTETYRLLSEAEWEYCCRAGTETEYWFGDNIRSDQANFGSEGTSEVGSFPANAFGLYDMHGNVYEWVEDAWRDSYLDKPQILKETGGAWTTGDSSAHVLRGGSWYYSPDDLRSAFRSRYRSDFRYIFSGFRVARTL